MKLYDNIAKTLSKKNINLVVGDIYDFMAIWKSWYRGSVNDFHYYSTKLADGTTCMCERLTMNMPKKVCEDISKLLWTEKTQIVLSSKRATDNLYKVLKSKENNFDVNFPAFLEKELALGSGATIEYKKDGKTIIEYVDGDVVIPYQYTNSYIYGLITVSRFIEEQKGKTIYYTHITYHEYNGKEYVKLNELYKSKDEDTLGKEIDFAEKFPEVENPFIVETGTPYFQFIKPNIANNLDTSSPMGISVLANSIDRFKAIDLKYDDFMNEFDLGRRRVLVDASALKGKTEITEDGKPRYVQYFDKNDKVFNAVQGMEDQPVKEINFDIRAQQYIDSINAELNWLSSNVGLGANFYKFNGNAVSTKTIKEVMSENSEAFRTKERHQLMVDNLIEDMVKAICELEGIKTNSITIIHDDSIIEDKDSEQIRASSEVGNGTRSKRSYMRNIRKMSEEEIEQELQEIQEEKQSSASLFGFDNTSNEEKSEEDNKKDEKKEEKGK